MKAFSLLLFVLTCALIAAMPAVGFAQNSSRVHPLPKILDDRQVSSGLEATDDSCWVRYLRAHNMATAWEPGDTALASAAYDSLKAVLADCYATQYGCLPFGDMTAAVSNLDNNDMWLTHRNYLVHVFPLSSIECYECGDIAGIEQTFLNYRRPGGAGIDYNGYVAIIDYLLKSHRCTSQNDTLLGEKRKSARQTQYLIWSDTVKNPDLTPMDTAAVSLESIGLGFLLKSNVVAPVATGEGIESFAVAENPFDREALLRYSLRGPEMAEIEIYDILGNRLWQSDKIVGDKETREVRVPLSGIERIYYARLRTTSGSSRTLRLMRR